MLYVALRSRLWTSLFILGRKRVLSCVGRYIFLSVACSICSVFCLGVHRLRLLCAKYFVGNLNSVCYREWLLRVRMFWGSPVLSISPFAVGQWHWHFICISFKQLASKDLYLGLEFSDLYITIGASWIFISSFQLHFTVSYQCVLIVTEEFAVDLGRGLRWEKPTVLCLWPITDIFHLKIH